MPSFPLWGKSPCIEKSKGLAVVRGTALVGASSCDAGWRRRVVPYAVRLLQFFDGSASLRSCSWGVGWHSNRMGLTCKEFPPCATCTTEKCVATRVSPDVQSVFWAKVEGHFEGLGARNSPRPDGVVLVMAEVYERLHHICGWEGLRCRFDREVLRCKA